MRQSRNASMCRRPLCPFSCCIEIPQYSGQFAAPFPLKPLKQPIFEFPHSLRLLPKYLWKNFHSVDLSVLRPGILGPAFPHFFCQYGTRWKLGFYLKYLWNKFHTVEMWLFRPVISGPVFPHFWGRTAAISAKMGRQIGFVFLLPPQRVLFFIPASAR